jgi:hypothetical protein
MAYHYCQNTEQNHATKINPVQCGELTKSGIDTNKLKPIGLLETSIK